MPSSAEKCPTCSAISWVRDSAGNFVIGSDKFLVCGLCLYNEIRPLRKRIQVYDMSRGYDGER